MTSKSPEAIVAELLSNPDLYAEKAALEGEVWGEAFASESQISVRKADKAASRELRVARDKLFLAGALRRQGLKPMRGLSLACGSGRAERNAIAQGICTSFHGIDVAEEAIVEARNMAKKEQLNITYETGDLNKIKLQPDSYDLVITQNCLHHVLHLESLAKEIHQAMKPDGALWIHDYIGETQFQYSEKRLEIANTILKLLPAKFRTNHITGKVITHVVRPTPGGMPSPFEAIRSAEIMPIFLERFDILEKHENGAIMRLVVPIGAKSVYVEDEQSKAMFELLYFLDDLLVKEGILEPTGIQCLLRPKPLRDQ
jgi:2-polyprenyl-3-methyl-5-hydroxy-6-metoxy-1,4-benzoquinol methylase